MKHSLYALLLFTTTQIFSQEYLKKVTGTIDAFACNFDAPAESVFDPVGTLNGTVTLRPQNTGVHIRNVSVMLNDDHLTVTGSFSVTQETIPNISEVELQAFRNGRWETVKRLTGSAPTPGRVYKWRNYSAGDKAAVTRLCEEASALLVAISVASGQLNAHSPGESFKIVDRFAGDFNPGATRGGSFELHPKDLEQMHRDAASHFNELLDNRNRNRERYEAIKRQIAVINRRYPIIQRAKYNIRYTHAGILTLPAGATALRLRLRRTLTDFFSQTISVSVKEAPKVLTLLSMGGACLAGCRSDSGSGSRPSSSSSSSSSSGSSSGANNLNNAGYQRDEEECATLDIPDKFVPELATLPSINCEDACDFKDCWNLMYLMAKRIYDAGAAHDIKSINMAGDDFCSIHSNPDQVRNQIIIGRFRNSLREDCCQSSLVYETAISSYLDAGYKHLILLGHSHGGAKFADMVTDHWSWGDNLSLNLMILWDATSAAGAVKTVGERPDYVLNFYQRGKIDNSGDVWFQKGDAIKEADEEYNLDGCFSHKGLAISSFVHNTSLKSITSTIQSIRDAARQ